MLVYIAGTGVVFLLSMWLLRDTTPIQFSPPVLEDMSKPRGEMASKTQLEDVYWRMSIRHASTALEEICKHEDYTVLTHKNIIMDGQTMLYSYIYLCNAIDDVQSVLNARTVISRNAAKTVNCLETYGNTTKTIVRKYPFSLKYISSQTFQPQTRVIRNAREACIWLHAVDIVESIWD
jgi:hypothetical protein